jgi:glycerophosphoryl diester phosphodiesterase
MPSFQAAADAGADMVELDVRLTADRVLVVPHDMSLRRTAGVRRRIRELTAADIGGLDAGARFGRRFKGAAIPKLSDVFAWRPAGLGIIVEVKTQGDTRGAPAYVGPLLDIADRIPAGKLIISSFSRRLLALVHAAAPGLTLGCLFVPVRDRNPLVLARATGASVFICSAGQARPRLVRAAQAGGLAVFVYGINTVRRAERFRSLGVHGMITDVPARILQSLNRTGRSL